jgi:hypothetical protein
MRISNSLFFWPLFEMHHPIERMIGYHDGLSISKLAQNTEAPGY